MAQSEFFEDLQRFWNRLTTRGAPVSTSATWTSLPPAPVLLERAEAFFRNEQTQAANTRAAEKLADVRRFELAGMQRVVAICAYGSSGSLLLASYLDGHDDVVMLPEYLGCGIYPFFDRYRSLSLRDKLLAYPFLWNRTGDHFKVFFEREYAIRGADYLAAVDAVLEVYGGLAADLRESRGVFFRLLHVAYSVALGRIPVSPRPWIVYAQHGVNATLAQYLVEDFTDTRFVHTVRDPISNCGRSFEHYFISRGFMAAAYVISHLTIADAPHLGMESRTVAVRFEDLHLHLPETMGRLADWLGLAYGPSLLESTFNGRPFVAMRGTTTWTGARPAQAVRDSRNVSFTDRALLFAVLYENFAQWGYPCPRPFRLTLVRIATCLLFLIIPTRMEMLTARRILKSGDVRIAGKGLMRLATGRVAIVTLLVVELYRRLVFGKRVLLPLQGSVSLGARSAELGCQTQ